MKRTGDLIRYVMSRDDIASCAEEKFPFSITCAMIDFNHNQIYLVPFNSKSISIWKIVDTNPSVMKIKEIIDEETNEIYISDLALSPDESHLVALFSDQSIVLYQNTDYPQSLARLKIIETRSLICDLAYWDNQTVILFYSDGSMSFHEGQETLEEYRYESNQLNQSPRLCPRSSEDLFLIDQRTTPSNESELEEENPGFITRLFRSLKDSTESITERLLLLEHSDPDRLIETLLNNGDYGGALRVCKVFNRTDLADQIHERESRLSSSQLGAHCTRIQSRLRVLILCTSILYPTFDEQYQLIQFGLQQATRKQLFDNLFYSDQSFFQSIHDESLHLRDVQEKVSPLNIPQKQILLYRRKLLDEKRKLFLYDDLINKSKLFSQYQPTVFDKFRQWTYPQIAVRCAREGHLNGLRLVIDRAIPSITPIELFDIFKEIPETISLIEYEDLIPTWNSISKQISKQEEPDWTDQYITPSEEPKSTIDRSAFIQWYENRILSFELFGLIENALHLSKHALETENMEEFSSLYKLLYLESLLNKISEQDLTLTQLKNMSNDEIFDVILTFRSDFNQDEIDKRIERILLPTLELIDQSKELLLKNLIEKLQNTFDIYPIIRSLKVKLNSSSNQFDQIIKDLILHVNSIHQISIASHLLTLMKDKQDLEYILE